MKLTFREKFAYGLGDTASNLVWATMTSFLMYYYTDIFGLTAAATGILFLFARVADGVVDFLMGAIADRTRTRWGKFRPYLLWMCLPLALSYVLTFTAPSFSVTGKLIYAWITYNLMMVFYTAINIPYSALSGVMTDDALDRTSLNSYRMSLAQVGGIFVNATMLPLSHYFARGHAARGYQITVILFSTAAVSLFLITFAYTRERIQPSPSQKTRLRDDLHVLLRNRHWVVMFITGIITLTFIIARAGVGLYYCRYYLQMNDKQISLYLVFGSAAFIVGALSTRFVVARFGKKWAFIFTMAGIGLSIVPFYWLTPSQIIPIYLLQLLHGVFAGMNSTLYWAMIADTADFSDWKFGIRNTGIAFSATTCSQKMGMGIGGALAGGILTHFGYQPGLVQSPAATHGILLLMSLIPAAGFLFLAGFFVFYGLNEERCEMIRRALEQRREQMPAQFGLPLA